MKLNVATLTLLLTAMAAAAPHQPGQLAKRTAQYSSSSSNSNDNGSFNSNSNGSGSNSNSNSNENGSSSSSNGNSNGSSSNTNSNGSSGSTNSNGSSGSTNSNGSSGSTNSNGSSSNTNSNGSSSNTNSNGSNTSSSSNGSSSNTNSGSTSFNNGGNTNNSGTTSSNGNSGNIDQATAQFMQTAVNDWMRDTGVVSNFLNIGKGLTDEQTFKNQALIAHSAEVDELTHKNVLDQFLPNNQNVQGANATLSNGAFQLVVDQLQNMASNGISQSNGIDIINNDRCINVLPNIDTYLREATLAVGSGTAVQQSVRPAACGNIVAGQNGAAQVGQPPAGYVNGKLQNGNSNTNPNIPSSPAGDDPQ